MLKNKINSIIFMSLLTSCGIYADLGEPESREVQANIDLSAQNKDDKDTAQSSNDNSQGLNSGNIANDSENNTIEIDPNLSDREKNTLEAINLANNKNLFIEGSTVNSCIEFNNQGQNCKVTEIRKSNGEQEVASGTCEMRSNKDKSYISVKCEKSNGQPCVGGSDIVSNESSSNPLTFSSTKLGTEIKISTKTCSELLGSDLESSSEDNNTTPESNNSSTDTDSLDLQKLSQCTKECEDKGIQTATDEFKVCTATCYQASF